MRQTHLQTALPNSCSICEYIKRKPDTHKHKHWITTELDVHKHACIPFQRNQIPGHDTIEHFFFRGYITVQKIIFRRETVCIEWMAKQHFKYTNTEIKMKKRRRDRMGESILEIQWIRNYHKRIFCPYGYSSCLQFQWGSIPFQKFPLKNGWAAIYQKSKSINVVHARTHRSHNTLHKFHFVVCKWIEFHIFKMKTIMGDASPFDQVTKSIEWMNCTRMARIEYEFLFVAYWCLSLSVSHSPTPFPSFFLSLCVFTFDFSLIII